MNSLTKLDFVHLNCFVLILNEIAALNKQTHLLSKALKFISNYCHAVFSASCCVVVISLSDPRDHGEYLHYKSA